MVDDSNGKVDFVGNRTECALLVMARNWGQNYRELRDIHHDQTVGEWRGKGRGTRSEAPNIQVWHLAAFELIHRRVPAWMSCPAQLALHGPSRPPPADQGPTHPHATLPPHPPLLAEVYGFSSERKMASVLVRRHGALRLYNKGAAEMVLSRCTAMVNAGGESQPMTEVGRWHGSGGGREVGCLR